MNIIVLITCTKQTGEWKVPKYKIRRVSYEVQRKEPTCKFKQNIYCNDKECDNWFTFSQVKKKKKHHMAHLKCHLLKTVRTLTETPSCLRACTYGMELCHMLKH